MSDRLLIWLISERPDNTLALSSSCVWRSGRYGAGGVRPLNEFGDSPAVRERCEDPEGDLDLDLLRGDLERVPDLSLRRDLEEDLERDLWRSMEEAPEGDLRVDLDEDLDRVLLEDL